MLVIRKIEIANGTIAWVVHTGAFYALSGETWYNQDGTGAYSSGG